MLPPAEAGCETYNRYVLPVDSPEGRTYDNDPVFPATEGGFTPGAQNSIVGRMGDILTCAEKL